jgi:hypothetical protein
VNFQSTARSESDGFQNWTSQQGRRNSFPQSARVFGGAEPPMPGALLARLGPMADIVCCIHQRDV